MIIHTFYNENGKTFEEVMTYFLIEFCDKTSIDLVEKYA